MCLLSRSTGGLLCFFCCCCIFLLILQMFLFSFFYIFSFALSLTQCEQQKKMWKIFMYFSFLFYCESFYFMNEFLFFLLTINEIYCSSIFSFLTLLISCYCEWIVNNLAFVFTSKMKHCLYKLFENVICKVGIIIGIKETQSTQI